MEGTQGSRAVQQSDRPGSVMLGFGQVVMAVSQRARALGLVVPAFRSPTGGGGVRSLRLHPVGPPTVLVPYHGRSLTAVAGDVVAGVLAVNPGSEAVEADLKSAAGAFLLRLDPPDKAVSLGTARVAKWQTLRA